MPATPFDSAALRRLFSDPDTAGLFTDSAEIRAMLLVWGALAEAQAEAGLIPADSAAAIHRAAMEVQIDPAALAEATARNGVVVPALLAAFRAAMQAPEHAQFVHWGATSQDIIDTALVLRLRPWADRIEALLAEALRALAEGAETHAELPMLARTWGQWATPTGFGAVLADWGGPLMGHLDGLAALRPRLLVVSLGGAAGTLSALGAAGPAVRAGLARRLGLGDPGHSWHASRDAIAELAGWAARLTGSLGKMGADLTDMCASGTGTVILPGAGGSSTMPQKRNPVAPGVLEALAGHVAALAGSVTAAMRHRGQRDGAAWMREWLALPQICIGAARAAGLAGELARGLSPDPAAMADAFARSRGLPFAEALSFALASRMPRPEAQARVKELCAQAQDEGGDLESLARGQWPDLPPDLFRPEASLGQAPAVARDFARAARRML